MGGSLCVLPVSDGCFQRRWLPVASRRRGGIPVALGRWRLVKTASDDGRHESVKVRPLFIDGRSREYASGALHEVTHQHFVIRRARLVNYSLPDEAGRRARWVWAA